MKIIIIGDPGVGKTSLVKRFVSGRFSTDYRVSIGTNIFIKKFKFARVWGKSVKFNGAQVGLNHKLKDNDIVELHLK